MFDDIPDLRDGILTSSVGDGGKHPMTLQELQRMFAYLRDSERKAYNPLSFCKTYEMDHQPLNTGEQKDMAEFFIDLLSKMEEDFLQGGHGHPIAGNTKRPLAGDLLLLSSPPGCLAPKEEDAIV